VESRSSREVAFAWHADGLKKAQAGVETHVGKRMFLGTELQKKKNVFLF
jgi:hypothetical protein